MNSHQTANLALAISLYRYKRHTKHRGSYKSLIASIIQNLENSNCNPSSRRTVKQTGTPARRARPRPGGKIPDALFSLIEPSQNFAATTFSPDQLLSGLYYAIIMENSPENCRHIRTMVATVASKKLVARKHLTALFRCSLAAVKYETEANRFVTFKLNQLCLLLTTLQSPGLQNLCCKVIFYYLIHFKYQGKSIDYPNVTVQRTIQTNWNWLKDTTTAFHACAIDGRLALYLIKCYVLLVKSKTNGSLHQLTLALLLVLQDRAILETYTLL